MKVGLLFDSRVCVRACARVPVCWPNFFKLSMNIMPLEVFETLRQMVLRG